MERFFLGSSIHTKRIHQQILINILKILISYDANIQLATLTIN